MNTAAHEQDNSEEWRIRLYAHQRGNSPLQRKISIKRAKLSARHKSIRDSVLAALVWLVGTAIFIWIGYAI